MVGQCLPISSYLHIVEGAASSSRLFSNYRAAACTLACMSGTQSSADMLILLLWCDVHQMGHKLHCHRLTSDSAAGHVRSVDDPWAACHVAC